MLDISQIRALAKSFTYKPGWEFEFYVGRFEYNHCVIRTPVIDAYDPAKTVLLDVHSMLPPFQSSEQFYDWLLHRLCRIEIHEAREFARVDGVCWSDPHADGADQDK